MFNEFHKSFLSGKLILGVNSVAPSTLVKEYDGYSGYGYGSGPGPGGVAQKLKVHWIFEQKLFFEFVVVVVSFCFHWQMDGRTNERMISRFVWQTYNWKFSVAFLSGICKNSSIDFFSRFFSPKTEKWKMAKTSATVEGSEGQLWKGDFWFYWMIGSWSNALLSFE